ncbi:IucA/IucC family protein [Solwaraspora sp. WMMD1047]|uniref:IucA/IucC family protein n=1 Tax=Solwaraspora sp. WMMD1047 TaxID=3016102 RepID=UPI002417A97B|nr:IucA/IucC family protein [Solwaraspora sp. WMMD1047]MDG4831041.1 IucA/IucC family protein [Solwaraspora sp. WMMD1047]
MSDSPVRRSVPSVAVVLPGPVEVGDDLARCRPELSAGYAAELPAARAAVLARLWGALSREPIAGVAGREERGGRLTVVLSDGRRLSGPVSAAAPFAVAAAGLVVRVRHPDGSGGAYADPAELLAGCGLPGRGGGFAAEVANSVANLALARAARPAPVAGGGAGGGLVEPPAGWESMVVDGHPLHPGCRTRAGMSTGQVLAYAPEHRPRVALRLVAVPAGRWFSTGAGLAPVLPVHPWQYERLVEGLGWLRDTGRRLPVRPLMSLRTVSVVGEPGRQLKTAVDVQMTSAVRTVSEAAVRNGPPVTAFLAGLAARAGSGLTVLVEPAAGAVLVDGRPWRSLAVVQRRVPPVGAGEVVLPLAVLAAAGVDGRPVSAAAVDVGCAGDPVRWLAALARVVLPGPLALLRWGVALEAHGQNLLVVLRAGRPVRLWYRDVGGIRVSPAGLARYGLAPPPLHGDLAADDPQVLRDTLLGALGVALGEQVAVLSRTFGVAPGSLWRAVAEVARGVPAAAGDRAALFGATWPVKATTAMRLATDPLDVRWARVPGPLAGLAGR